MEFINNYLNSLKNLKSSKFIKDVSIVAGGTVTAQLITVAFTPLITRLYGPDAFGILGVFISIVGLISVVANLSYAQAIVIPASDNEAKVLAKLSFIITCFIVFLTAIVMGFLRNDIAFLLGFEAESIYLLLVPIVVLFVSCEQILTQWLVRKRQFKTISSISIIQAATTGIAKVGCGYFSAIAPTLLIINTLTHFLHSTLLWIRSKPVLNITRYSNFNNIRFSDPIIRDIAINYRDFPYYNSPTKLLNSVSQNFPLLLIAAMFDPVASGYYALTMRVLRMPITLISDSVGKVFSPRIAEAFNKGEKLQPLILKATFVLLFVGLLPFGVIVALGPWLFEIIFGSEWIVAGEYARWLSILLYMQFINRPSIIAIPIMGLQSHYLGLEVIASSIRIIAILFGALYFKDDLVAIALFSLSGTIFYLMLILWVMVSSRNCKRN